MKAIFHHLEYEELNHKIEDSRIDFIKFIRLSRFCLVHLTNSEKEPCELLIKVFLYFSFVNLFIHLTKLLPILYLNP